MLNTDKIYGICGQEDDTWSVLNLARLAMADAHNKLINQILLNDV